MLPCGLMKDIQQLRRIFHLHLQDQRLSPARNQHKAGSKQNLVSSSTLIMEVVHSSRISDDFHQSTWHYILEQETIHSHPCENLKSYNVIILSLGKNIHVRCVPVTTAWCVLGLLMEEQPPAMEGSCEYNE
jgi:hypothetical protein